MKKTYVLLLVVVIIFSACQQKVSTKSVDITAVRGIVNELMDKYMNSFLAKDSSAMISMLSEEGLFCGTAPSEFWNKKEISDLWIEMAKDTATDYHFSVDKREIMVAKDGNSAIVIEQFLMNPLSTKIPIRTIYQVVKEKDIWVFNFISWAFIPENRDISKLNKALE